MTTPEPLPLEEPPGATGTATGVPWWRMPFSADTWKRTLYALVALPAGVAGTLLALVGARAASSRFQRELARTLLRAEIEEPPRPGKGAALHGLAGLPLNLVSLAVAAYGWLLVPMNTVLYPLRAGDPPLDAWGGPTLAGAWALHGAAGLAFLFLVPWAVRGLTGLQAALARRVLG